jgi:hypothetical protein
VRDGSSELRMGSLKPEREWRGAYCPMSTHGLSLQLAVKEVLTPPRPPCTVPPPMHAAPSKAVSKADAPKLFAPLEHQEQAHALALQQLQRAIAHRGHRRIYA